MQNCFFLMSYASQDNKPDAYPKEFFTRLEAAVAGLIPLGEENAEGLCGFFDETSIRTGSEWHAELVRALMGCRVLVCLYSTAYFGSEWCGKEFQIFTERLNGYVHEHGGELPALILPVLWGNPARLPRPLPPLVQRIQYRHDIFEERYQREGLEYIIRQKKRYGDEYEAFIMSFAEVLIDAAGQWPLVSSARPISLETAMSAFAPVALPATPSIHACNVEGMNAARFVYVAGRSEELRSVRNEVKYYHEESGRFWRPYLHEEDKTVGSIAAIVAGEEDIQHEYLPIDDNVLRLIEQAENTNTPVVICVDPWTVRLERYKNFLESYDARGFVNSSVLVIWNRDDSETADSRNSLEEGIRKVLYRNCTLYQAGIRQSVQTPQQFRSELKAVISEIRGRLMARGKVFKPVNGHTNLPIISGNTISGTAVSS